MIKTSAAPDKEPLSGDTNANDHNNKDVSELPKWRLLLCMFQFDILALNLFKLVLLLY